MKKNIHTVSVVMPVYNSKSTIERAIDSILMQTYTDFEFIIINEASTNDGTTEILERYAREDERIHLIQKKNEKKGVATSLNIGLREATGKYIARMDADDYSYPTRFQRQIEYMEANPQISICGAQMKVFNSEKYHLSEYSCDPEIIRIEALFDSPIAHPTVFIRRQFLIEHSLFYDEDCLPEDFDLWTRVLRAGGIIANLNEVLFDYHNEGNGNVTSAKNIPFYKAVSEIRKRELRNNLGMNIDEETAQIFDQVTGKAFSDKGNPLINKAVELLSLIETNNEAKNV